MIFLEREGSGPQPCLGAAQVNDTLTQSEHMMSFSDTAIKRWPSAVSQFRASSFKVHILWLIDGNRSLSVVFFPSKCTPVIKRPTQSPNKSTEYHLISFNHFYCCICPYYLDDFDSRKYACILWFYHLIIKCKDSLLCLVFKMCVSKGSPKYAQMPCSRGFWFVFIITVCRTDEIVASTTCNINLWHAKELLKKLAWKRLQRHFYQNWSRLFALAGFSKSIAKCCGAQQSVMGLMSPLTPMEILN